MTDSKVLFAVVLFLFACSSQPKTGAEDPAANHHPPGPPTPENFEDELARVNKEDASSFARASELFDAHFASATDEQRWRGITALRAFRRDALTAYAGAFGLGGGEKIDRGCAESLASECPLFYATEKFRNGLAQLLESGAHWDHVGEGEYALAANTAWLAARHRALLHISQAVFLELEQLDEEQTKWEEGSCPAPGEMAIKWESYAREFQQSPLAEDAWKRATGRLTDFLTACSCSEVDLSEPGNRDTGDGCSNLARWRRDDYKQFSSRHKESVFAGAVADFYRELEESKFRSSTAGIKKLAEKVLINVSQP